MSEIAAFFRAAAERVDQGTTPWRALNLFRPQEDVIARHAWPLWESFTDGYPIFGHEAVIGLLLLADIIEGA